MKLLNKDDPIGYIYRYDKNSEWRISGHNLKADLPEDAELYQFWWIDVVDDRVEVRLE